jgi:hypothetical protein
MPIALLVFFAGIVALILWMVIVGAWRGIRGVSNPFPTIARYWRWWVIPLALLGFGLAAWGWIPAALDLLPEGAEERAATVRFLSVIGVGIAALVAAIALMAFTKKGPWRRGVGGSLGAIALLSIGTLVLMIFGQQIAEWWRSVEAPEYVMLVLNRNWWVIVPFFIVLGMVVWYARNGLINITVATTVMVVLLWPIWTHCDTTCEAEKAMQARQEAAQQEMVRASRTTDAHCSKLKVRVTFGNNPRSPTLVSHNAQCAIDWFWGNEQRCVYVRLAGSTVPHGPYGTCAAAKPNPPEDIEYAWSAGEPFDAFVAEVPRRQSRLVHFYN